MLELQFFFFFFLNCYCDERLLVSEKMILVVGANVKVRLLVLPNVMIELSIVRKKNRVPPNVTKVRSEVMWVLPNVIIKKS